MVAAKSCDYIKLMIGMNCVVMLKGSSVEQALILRPSILLASALPLAGIASHEIYHKNGDSAFSCRPALRDEHFFQFIGSLGKKFVSTWTFQPLGCLYLFSKPENEINTIPFRSPVWCVKGIKLSI